MWATHSWVSLGQSLEADYRGCNDGQHPVRSELNCLKGWRILRDQTVIPGFRNGWTQSLAAGLEIINSIYFIFQSKFKGIKNHFTMISLVFTISLKGNKAASSHISIYAELRGRDKAIPP